MRDEKDTTPFAVLTKAELSSFRVDETIRAKSPSKAKTTNTRNSGKDLLQYFEKDNESVDEDFPDVTDSMFQIPVDLALEPVVITTQFRRIASSHSVASSPSPQRIQRAEAEELAYIGRPSNPNSFSTYAVDELAGASSDLTKPRKKLRLPRLPRKYFKGSGTDPYNSRYHD